MSRSASPIRARPLLSSNLWNSPAGAGARIIVLTNYATSPLAAIADVVLCSTAQGSPLLGENAAARIAQLVIFDAVFAAVAQRDLKAAERNLAATMGAVTTKRRTT